MSEESFKKTVITGEILGEVVLAFVTVVHLLKRQPGFDIANFNDELKQAISKNESGAISSEIFKQCVSLDDD